MAIAGLRREDLLQRVALGLVKVGAVVQVVGYLPGISTRTVRASVVTSAPS